MYQPCRRLIAICWPSWTLILLPLSVIIHETDNRPPNTHRVFTDSTSVSSRAALVIIPAQSRPASRWRLQKTICSTDFHNQGCVRDISLKAAHGFVSMGAPHRPGILLFFLLKSQKLQGRHEVKSGAKVNPALEVTLLQFDTLFGTLAFFAQVCYSKKQALIWRPGAVCLVMNRDYSASFKIQRQPCLFHVVSSCWFAFWC